MMKTTKTDTIFTLEELDQLAYACADGERLYRRIRKGIRAGEWSTYTEEECTEKMKQYRTLYDKIRAQLPF